MLVILLAMSGALLSNVMMVDKRFRRPRENAINEAVPKKEQDVMTTQLEADIHMFAGVSQTGLSFCCSYDSRRPS